MHYASFAYLNIGLTFQKTCHTNQLSLYSVINQLGRYRVLYYYYVCIYLLTYFFIFVNLYSPVFL